MTTTKSRHQHLVTVTLTKDEFERVDEIAAEREWTRAATVRHFFRRSFTDDTTEEKQAA